MIRDQKAETARAWSLGEQAIVSLHGQLKAERALTDDLAAALAGALDLLDADDDIAVLERDQRPVGPLPGSERTMNDACKCGHARVWHDPVSGRCEFHCGNPERCPCWAYREARGWNAARSRVKATRMKQTTNPPSVTMRV